MASVSELVEDVASAMGERVETVNAYARALIDAGELPKSKGRAIATVSNRDVVTLFTAVALEPKIKDTAQVVTDYLSMTAGVPVGAPHSISFTARDWLESMLGTIYDEALTDEDKASRKAMIDQEIVFVSNGPEIEVRAEDQSTIVRFKRGSALFWNGYHKRTTVLSCRAFLFLGLGNGRGYTKWEND